MKRVFQIVCMAALLFLVPLSSQAAMITYNLDGRPILFEDIELSGTTYDVEVEWGTTYLNAYPTPGMFMNTNYAYDPVLGATNALGAALADDGFTALGGSPVGLINPTSYKMTGFGQMFGGRLIRLHLGPEVYEVSAMVGYPNTTYLNYGFTHWEVVPEPATVTLLTLGGLAILRRRRNC
jgi:hypothetical protein